MGTNFPDWSSWSFWSSSAISAASSPSRSWSLRIESTLLVKELVRNSTASFHFPGSTGPAERALAEDLRRLGADRVEVGALALQDFDAIGVDLAVALLRLALLAQILDGGRRRGLRRGEKDIDPDDVRRRRRAHAHRVVAQAHRERAHLHARDAAIDPRLPDARHERFGRVDGDIADRGRHDLDRGTLEKTNESERKECGKVHSRDSQRGTDRKLGIRM